MSTKYSDKNSMGPQYPMMGLEVIPKAQVDSAKEALKSVYSIRQVHLILYLGQWQSTVECTKDNHMPTTVSK